MLDTLFGSATRYALLRVLVFNPGRLYTPVELAKKSGLTPASVRAELKRLQQSALVRLQEKDKQRMVQVNADAAIFPELRALLLKAQLLTEQDFGAKLARLGRVQYAVLTGYFTNVPEAQTDVFIVGTVNRQKLRRLVRAFQRAIDHNLRFTVLSKREYKYRSDITDRFLYDIVENRKIVLIDKLQR